MPTHDSHALSFASLTRCTVHLCFCRNCFCLTYLFHPSLSVSTPMCDSLTLSLVREAYLLSRGTKTDTILRLLPPRFPDSFVRDPRGPA